MKKWIRILDKCTGCRMCEVICSFYHHKEFNPKAAAIHVVYIKENEVKLPKAITCRQCTRAPCLESCPEEAISRDEETNAIIVNADKCIGCVACVEACPFNAARLHPINGTAIICDLCRGQPQCVEWCPVENLLWKERI